jgi:prophage maintenance system killer protein
MLLKDSPISKIIYPKLAEYHEFIFHDIRKLVYDDHTKPTYEKDLSGLEELASILEFVKNNDYYPTIAGKAAYLLVSISTGQKFGNGNKRLALFTYLYFLNRNKIGFRPRRVKAYRKWFKKYFPKYKMSVHNFRINAGWALYNFNKCINIKAEEKKNGHSYDYDGLKAIAEQFTEFIYK